MVDASVALTGMHLAGTPKKIGLILASFDPVVGDAVSSAPPGHVSRKIEYLRLANGVLGDVDNTRILEG